MQKTLRFLLFIVYAVLVSRFLHQSHIEMARTFQLTYIALAAPALSAFGGGLLLMLDKLWVLFTPALGKLRLNLPELVFGVLLLLFSLFQMWAFTIFSAVPFPLFLLYTKNLDALCGFAAGVLLAQAFSRELMPVAVEK